MTTHESIIIGIVFLLVGIDYVTGVINATMQRELSSKKNEGGTRPQVHLPCGNLRSVDYGIRFRLHQSWNQTTRIHSRLRRYLSD